MSCYNILVAFKQVFYFHCFFAFADTPQNLSPTTQRPVLKACNHGNEPYSFLALLSLACVVDLCFQDCCDYFFIFVH